ncbi:glycosyltransferase [Marinobacterium mangrovicola]|uniref:Glycosyltransferase involved in cell wall biosynthesis n=1 Tax=Marinobacterium mangrovicola TaxID=1476959 RepID=A0A4R1GJQ6_9GAMM|nr:glycosyltransferase [Marinobacterium mangrovicola]TCK07125.1 glycosyltransferase involved in cell wall biosynthesis [Marinobacterium mangrovicola]
MKRKVAVFRTNLLAISETFIREQICSLNEWGAILVGRNKLPDGVDISDLDYKLIPIFGGRFFRIINYLFSLPDRRLVRTLKQGQFSLVHAHFGMDAVSIWPSVRAARIPMIVTLHGYDINIYRWWWENGNSGWLHRFYPKKMLKMAKDPSVRFIAVSNAIKKAAINYGIDSKKIDVCYIGVDTKKFKPSRIPLEFRKKRILFVGRMVEKKAPLLLIQAYSKVLEDVPGAELFMIGTGPMLKDAKKLASDLKAPVKFMGAQNSDQVLQQLNESRVFCLPSVTAKNGDSEGLPISILEALACGVPVVTSAKGAVDEVVINKNTGFCVKENDVDDLSSSLIKALTLDDASRLSENALKDIDSKFSLSYRAKELEKIYGNVARN